MNLYILEYQGMFAKGMITIAEVSVENLVRNFRGHLKWFFSHNLTDYYRRWDWFEEEDGEHYKWMSVFNEREFDANFSKDFQLVAKKYATIPPDDQDENVWSIESEFELRFQLNSGVYNFAFKRQT